jgi:hypothetical protein
MHRNAVFGWESLATNIHPSLHPLLFCLDKLLSLVTGIILRRRRRHVKDTTSLRVSSNGTLGRSTLSSARTRASTLRAARLNCGFGHGRTALVSTTRFATRRRTRSAALAARARRPATVRFGTTTGRLGQHGLFKVLRALLSALLTLSSGKIAEEKAEVGFTATSLLSGTSEKDRNGKSDSHKDNQHDRELTDGTEGIPGNSRRLGLVSLTEALVQVEVVRLIAPSLPGRSRRKGWRHGGSVVLNP